MNRSVKNAVKSLLKKTSPTRKLLFFRRLWVYLDDIGWLKSIEERLPVDRDGNALPWFTYPAISFLSKKVQPHMTVFEYGSGNSTLWWSKKASHVVACEHDVEWYRFLKEKIPSNVEYRHVDLEYGGEYCKAILEYNDKFDVVAIDGRDRVNCAKNAVGALKSDGVIVWDNSDREKYQEGCTHLLQHGFRRLDLEGFGPNGAKHWSTSVFYRGSNCFGI